MSMHVHTHHTHAHTSHTHTHAHTEKAHDRYINKYLHRLDLDLHIRHKIGFERMEMFWRGKWEKTFQKGTCSKKERNGEVQGIFIFRKQGDHQAVRSGPCPDEWWGKTGHIRPN